MTLSGLEIEPDVARWAVPLLDPPRYAGVKGGRTGGKSHQLCEIAATRMCTHDWYKVAGIREIQKSIKHSLKSLLEKKIHKLGGSYLFDFQQTEIKRIGGEGVAVFLGAQDHTTDSIKGLEDFDLGLVDEANGLSVTSLRKITPTLRKEGSGFLFAWNPDNENHAIDRFFAENEGHPDFLLLHVNIDENPFVSDTAWNEYTREKDKADAARKRVIEARRQRLEPEDADLEIIDVFEHVWRGAYNKRSQAIVFHNWRKKELITPDNVVWFYGVDWGFASDPNAGVKFCYLPQPGDTTDILYFRQAIEQHGTRTEDLPKFLKSLKGIEKWPSRADSARPETIDYCRRNGLPKMRGAKKGKGSVEDGYTFLQGLDLVLHPTDCGPLERELKDHRYKVVKHTGEILTVPEDANNHCLDGARYASEGLHRRGKVIKIQEAQKPDQGSRYFKAREESNWKTA